MRELAEYSGYSQRYLNRLFSQRMGMGMSICIRLRKLASASEELIYSNKTIAEIAERYHYESQHTFTRAFRRRYGVPPGVWRKENRVAALRENPAQCPADKA
ncbi:helix-turn-helix transcriptional regulator [Pantoea sp. SM3]|uniref:helix-turn-helix transcriptional regulator n=1 Tax=Pantoea sp. SM3 TaxID=1628192 RepID=UPI000695F075|nr:helix-turn-helix transcriptional regulator [Pantoea sp. SM3]